MRLVEIFSIFFLGLFFIPVAFSADVVATRCPHKNDEYKTSGTCWWGSFLTEKGAKVSIRAILRTLTSNASSLTPARLSVLVRYEDRSNYFTDAPKLGSYISIQKAKFLNQGTGQVTSEGSPRAMSAIAKRVYQLTFEIDLVSRPALFQEFPCGFTLAFSDKYPLTGDAKWDSNNHKNHGFWFR